ncbi:MAG TPA: hypothetical protein VMX13_01625 [Sedimentisphaerales bacterium]|nr:hypothetical protein [Sedimentisphaerales bacterium]
MKKIAIVVGILVVLFLVFKSKAIQNCANRFVESNVSHEQEQIQRFLSQ